MSLYTKIIDLQKLCEAWKKVKSNKPAAGIDEVSYEEFDHGIRENLKQLHLELEEHRYEALPVKLVDIYKGEKKRTISLFSMRDKVLHQAIAAELTKLYDAEFSDCTYAYRPGRAALQAIEYLGEEIKRDENAWLLKADIKDFFDSVLQDKLYHTLRVKIHDEDVIELIKECCEVRELQKDGELRKKTRGISQGSGIAPILSNIYLKKFDIEMKQRCSVFLRYSDDIIVFGESREQLESIKAFMKVELEILGLKLNENKTEIKTLEEGVTFLGYEFSKKGKEIPANAEENLEHRLEDIWLSSKENIRIKLQKSAAILEGWEQYYRNKREIRSIQEYVTVVYMVQHKSENILEEIKQKRVQFQNIYKEIGNYLANVWENVGDLSLALYEYEQLYELEELDEVEIADIEEIYHYFKELNKRETEEVWTELMQLYSDNGAYNKAAKIQEFVTKFLQDSVIVYEEIETEPEEETFDMKIDSDFLQEYCNLFVGREDVYGKEELESHKKRCVEQVSEPLTEDVIRKHLQGKITVSTFIQRSNATAKYLVIDVDISKRVLCQGIEEENIRKYLPQAAETVKDIFKLLNKMGLKVYLEDSGFRGYHIWLFFTEWIPVRYIIMLSEIIENNRTIKNESISVEYFPNKSKLRGESLGQKIKLPLGFHVHTIKRSIFMDSDFHKVKADKRYFMEVAKFSLLAIKKVIAFHNNMEEKIEEKEVDMDLKYFGEISDSIKVVLEKCSLMRYLCKKAKTTGYLTHFERMSILYVFGHLGEEGKMFVHTVMELTLNYQYHVTDKFIQKIPAKPVSCLKLREQYKQITAEYGCSCNFKRTKDCYPSPVLHAIKSSEDVAGDITIPTSRTLSKAKEKKVVEEINIHKKVQELAQKIIEMKKQRRGVDKAIQKTENELEKIYDQAGIDCLEVDMGLLVRRRKEQGYEWLIEI